MSVFYGMQADAVRREYLEKKAAAKAEQAAKDDAATAETVGQTAQTSTPEASGGSGERLFTQDEVNKIVRERLAKERAKGGPDADEVKRKELERQEMMTNFRADLTDHGLPAEDIIRVFDGLDLNSPEGLRFAVNDIIDLQETISEYAVQREVAKAARANMPKPEKADVLRQIFGLE